MTTIQAFNWAIDRLTAYLVKTTDMHLADCDDVGIDADGVWSLANDFRDGFTRPVKDISIVPRKGYVVAINGLGCHANSFESVEQWFNTVQWFIHNTDWQEYLYIGGWHNQDANRYELDICVIFQEREKAVAFGMANDQISVYDLDEGVEHKTGGSGGNYLPV